jgi:hypothetical protein
MPSRQRPFFELMRNLEVLYDMMSWMTSSQKKKLFVLFMSLLPGFQYSLMSRTSSLSVRMTPDTGISQHEISMAPCCHTKSRDMMTELIRIPCSCTSPRDSSLFIFAKFDAEFAAESPALMIHIGFLHSRWRREIRRLEHLRAEESLLEVGVDSKLSEIQRLGLIFE